MLVVSRNRGECIFIDSVIKVVIVDIRGDKVRVGIEAPKTMAIHRDDIFREVSPRAVIQETPAQACYRLENMPIEEMTRDDMCRRIGMLETENELLRIKAK